MADVIDDAQELIEKQLELSRRAIDLNTKRPEPTGHCLYCEAVVAAPKLYCDGECADDHAFELARTRQNVRVG